MASDGSCYPWCFVNCVDVAVALAGALRVRVAALAVGSAGSAVVPAGSSVGSATAAAAAAPAASLVRDGTQPAPPAACSFSKCPEHLPVNAWAKLMPLETWTFALSSADDGY